MNRNIYIYYLYVPRGTRRTTLAGLQKQRRVTHCAVGARHAFDARMRTRLARSVVAETQIGVEPGRTLFHARSRGLEHGRRTTGQAVFAGKVAAGFTGPVTLFALRSGPKLACFVDFKICLVYVIRTIEKRRPIVTSPRSFLLTR